MLKALNIKVVHIFLRKIHVEFGFKNLKKSVTPYNNLKKGKTRQNLLKLLWKTRTWKKRNKDSQSLT